jgi:restriction system protein
MIPDYQTLMRPVLEAASHGEIHMEDVRAKLAAQFDLTEEEQAQLLPSGRQTTFVNRVAWARAYLKQAGLIEPTKRGYIKITDRGKQALADHRIRIDNSYLKQFSEFQAFQTRGSNSNEQAGLSEAETDSITPDEILRAAHKRLTDALSAEILDKVRKASPAFFEYLIVELLVAMGYGGTAENAGQALGKSGDDGIDGVINQDPLGVDQIYVQAKRYAEGNNVSANAIRDFFGALNLKRAQKGLFFTTSDFTASAVETAKNLGMRIVLINGQQLGNLMIHYNVGCRDEDTIHIKRLDEDFFEWEGA